MTEVIAGHQVQRVEGVALCACLDATTDIGTMMTEAGKLLPPDTFLDAEPFNYGQQWGACAVYPDGRRMGVRFDPTRLPTPPVMAELLR